MSILSEFPCPNDAPIHGLAGKPLRLLLTDIGCGTPAPRSQTRHTHTTPHTTSALLTPPRRKSYVPASPGDYRQMEHTCMPIAPSGSLLLTDIGCGTLPLAPRPHTATPTACDSNLGSDNHDMSRLSTFSYLNGAPIHALLTYPYACSQRVLGVVPCPSLPYQTHITPQLRLNLRSHGQKAICV
jgi:hypothetical protein